MSGIIIPDGGTIGSASDTDAISIASDGKATLSQKPTFSQGIANTGTIDAGTLGSNVVMNSGSVVKTTAQSYHNVMVQNCNTTSSYSTNRTTSNTTELGAVTHTTKIDNPRITVWFSGQIGFQTYDTGIKQVWCSLFANDVWKTGIRTILWRSVSYANMLSCPLAYTETITESKGHSYVVKVRWNQDGDFSNNTGISNTPRVGLGHSGYDNSDGHKAYIIVQESVA